MRVRGWLVGLVAGAASAVAVGAVAMPEVFPEDRPLLVVSDGCGISVAMLEDPRVRRLVEEGTWAVRVADPVEGPWTEYCAAEVAWRALGRRWCLAMAERVSRIHETRVPDGAVPALYEPGGAVHVGTDEIGAVLDGPAAR